MYHTPNGNRVMLGAERELFETSLGMMTDLLCDSDVEFGLAAFDELQRGQKLFALYVAGRALLRPDEPVPKLTAFLEAAVATIYRFALEQVEQEIEEGESHSVPNSWRTLAFQAASEQGTMQVVPTAICTDRSEWQLVFESLESAVLWDHDFEIQVGMDIAPEEAMHLKEQRGIDDDYYTAVALDVPDAQFNLYIDALMGLTPRGRG
jgi:hypothetical protein